MNICLWVLLIFILPYQTAITDGLELEGQGWPIVCFLLSNRCCPCLMWNAVSSVMLLQICGLSRNVNLSLPVIPHSLRGEHSWDNCPYCLVNGIFLPYMMEGYLRRCLEPPIKFQLNLNGIYSFFQN